MAFERKSIPIQIKRELPGNRREVLRLFSHLEEFLTDVKFVKEIKKLPKQKPFSRYQWYVEVDSLPIRWIQKNSFNLSDYEIRFDTEEGDLQVFSGVWRLSKKDDQTTLLELDAEVVLGIPFFEDVVRSELERRIYKMFLEIFNIFEDKLLDRRYDNKQMKNKGKPKGFAVMGHPYNYSHLISIFKVFKPEIEEMSEEFLRKVFELAPSYKGYDIDEFKATSGKSVNGCFVMCPIIPDMAVLTPDIVLPKVLAGCRIAERNGAGILALGGFTSIVGERFLNVLKSKVKMPITTGNTFTVAMALAGVRKAAKLLDVDFKNARATIIGGTGDIGSACARVLNLEVKELVITGRTLSTLGKLKEELTQASGREVEVSTDNNLAAKSADIIIAAASSTEPVVDIHNIKAGAIVCDVGYPKNISYHSKHRDDLLVFSGGLCKVPTDFDIGIDVGLPNPRMLYGCWAEAIILSLEERFENFSEGKGLITVENVEWIHKAAIKHGFDVAPFFWGNQEMDEDAIQGIQSRLKSVQP